LFTVEKRRADIEKLLTCAVTEARLKKRQIDRVDPLVRCARRLFPYLHDEGIYDISRTALRILMSEQSFQASLEEHQTRLTEHVPV